MFDELIRHDKILSESCEEQFLKFVMSTHQMVRKKEDMANENIRLNSELIKSNQEIRVLEEKLKESIIFKLYEKNLHFCNLVLMNIMK